MDEIPPDSSETERLLAEARSGEPQVFAQLFERYQADLRQLIDMRLDDRLRRRIDASDVLQETQIEACRRLPAFLEKQPVPFRLWLRQIAHDQLGMAKRKHVRAARRTVTREVAVPQHSSVLLAEQLFAHGSTPSQHLARHELARRVQQAIAQLPETEREILLLRNFEKQSFKEIAYILQITPAAARTRHGRALQRLGRILRRGGLTEESDERNR